MFLHGSSHQNYAVAIVSPKKDKLEQLATKLNIQGSIEEKCKSNALRIEFLSALNAHAKK